jgi:peptide/nickel transport system substrate-binding protein
MTNRGASIPWRAALCLVVVVTAGCSSMAKTAQSTPTTATALGNLGTVTIATSFAIDNLDPLDNGFWGSEFGFGDLLMKPIGHNNLEPWLLESLTQTSPTVWTLKLRPNIKFQNGDPLDADALATTMTYSLANNTSVQPDLPGAKVAVAGPLTVTLTTAAPVAAVPSLLANESMFPIYEVAKYLPLKATPDALVAARIYTGPYTVTSLTPGQMELAPTAGYYGPKPTLAHLTIRFVSDAQARILAVEHGEADLALYPPTAAARQLQGHTDAYFLSQKPGDGYGGFRMVLNLRSAPFGDVKVRQAILHGIDYAAISGQVMNGHYDTAVGLYPAYLPYALHDQTTDLAAAKRLLDDDGWTAAGDGLRSKDGKTLGFTLLTYPQQPDLGPISLALQAELKDLGVAVQIHQVDDVTSTIKQPTGWDAALDGDSTLDWTATDPVQPLVDNFTTGGNDNYGGISDPQVDELAKQLVGTTDKAAQRTMLEQVQRIIVDQQAYSIYVTIKRDPVVASPRLRSYQVPPAALLWTDPFG